MRVLLCTALLATTAGITPRGRRASSFRGGAHRKTLPCWTRLSGRGGGGATANATTYAAPAGAAPNAAAFGRALAEWLGNGGVAVVPYDKEDANHMPALKGGRSAHYALVCGVATAADADADADAGGGGGLRLVAVHGMSRRPLVVTAAELEASNLQLTEVAQTVKTKNWVLGAAGMRLAGRLLCIG